ncbi:hypothetical protein DFP72DRAFT_1046442 [Ephemerocybe angulata]|uniref:Uncharacterized protein n=1 Tax=Ephemerocybe angulata TaxID=980116 RepID=A0A8H6HUX3_9AGAR|nr:hypothetical protein DFP72DRAFT_1046442 [Tulosesus angulatus]
MMGCVGESLNDWGIENGAWNGVFWVEWDEEEDGAISGCRMESGCWWVGGCKIHLQVVHNCCNEPSSRLESLQICHAEASASSGQTTGIIRMNHGNAHTEIQRSAQVQLGALRNSRKFWTTDGPESFHFINGCKYRNERETTIQELKAVFLKEIAMHAKI